MSTYLKMWDHVKKLTEEERKNWIKMLTPVRGVGVDFFSVNVCDVDLIEALKNAV